MKLKHIAGAFILVLPFIGIFIFAWIRDGFVNAIIPFACIFLLAACFWKAFDLLDINK